MSKDLKSFLEEKTKNLRESIKDTVYNSLSFLKSEKNNSPEVEGEKYSAFKKAAKKVGYAVASLVLAGSTLAASAAPALANTVGVNNNGSNSGFHEVHKFEDNSYGIENSIMPTADGKEVVAEVQVPNSVVEMRGLAEALEIDVYNTANSSDKKIIELPQIDNKGNRTYNFSFATQSKQSVVKETLRDIASGNPVNEKLVAIDGQDVYDIEVDSTINKEGNQYVINQVIIDPDNVISKTPMIDMVRSHGEISQNNPFTFAGYEADGVAEYTFKVDNKGLQNPYNNAEIPIYLKNGGLPITYEGFGIFKDGECFKETPLADQICSFGTAPAVTTCEISEDGNNALLNVSIPNAKLMNLENVMWTGKMNPDGTFQDMNNKIDLANISEKTGEFNFSKPLNINEFSEGTTVLRETVFPISAGAPAVTKFISINTKVGKDGKLKFDSANEINLDYTWGTFKKGSLELNLNLTDTDKAFGTPKALIFSGIGPINNTLTDISDTSINNMKTYQENFDIKKLGEGIHYVTIDFPLKGAKQNIPGLTLQPIFTIQINSQGEVVGVWEI